MQFISQLRQLSDGKPVGFKLCLVIRPETQGQGASSDQLAIMMGTYQTCGQVKPSSPQKPPSQNSSELARAITKARRQSCSRS